MSPRSAPSGSEQASWVLAGFALALIMFLHLLTALLAGLLVFELVHIISPTLQGHFTSARSRVVAVAMLATLIVGVTAATTVGIVVLSEEGGVSLLLQKMAGALENARNTLPPWLVDYLPGSVDAMRTALSQWLRDHAAQLRLAGAQTGLAAAQMLIGMIIGSMVSLREAVNVGSQKPLAAALMARAERVGDAFSSVVFAQVRISLINTVFTAIYLFVVLPLFGVSLPHAGILVVITFVAGLLPVVGNLISNTVIVVVSLASSIYVAIASLVFLIVIHKLEYFLNARIVGVRINARAWELLIAMLVMESAFGWPGLIAAPIYYAYLKAELADRGLV